MINKENLELKYKILLEDCFDFSPPDGWLILIEALFQKIMSLDDTIKVWQVKSKFAGLRVYTSPSSETIYHLIDLAEKLSLLICEICGRPAEYRTTGWMITLCSSCANDYDVNKKEIYK